MKLSEMSYDQVPLGLRVHNWNRTVLGTVVKKMPFPSRDYGSDGIEIAWDNGNVSTFTILELSMIDVVDSD